MGFEKKKLQEFSCLNGTDFLGRLHSRGVEKENFFSNLPVPIYIMRNNKNSVTQNKIVFTTYMELIEKKLQPQKSIR